MEEWRLIPGYSLYEASNRGRIRTYRTQRIRTPVNLRGYLCMQLKDDNRKLRTRGVHCFIAETFLGVRPPGKDTINHKNFDRSDNRPENLEFMSSSENMKHARTAGRYPKVTNPTGYNGDASRKGMSHTRVKITDDIVRMIRVSAKSDSELAKELKLSSRHVNDIRRRKYWGHI